MKLTDVPSLALLEMTFDLTTSENLKSSWKNQQTDYVRKKQRSKSVYSSMYCICLLLMLK